MANKRTAKITTSRIAIVSILYDYSVQRRTIGSFSATAGLFYLSSVVLHQNLITSDGQSVICGRIGRYFGTCCRHACDNDLTNVLLATELRRSSMQLKALSHTMNFVTVDWQRSQEISHGMEQPVFSINLTIVTHFIMFLWIFRSTDLFHVGITSLCTETQRAAIS